MGSHTEQIEHYLAGPAALRKAIAGMTPEQLKARPVAGRWSTLEVVVHIADFEPIISDRMMRVISHERPLLLVADENLFNAALHPHERVLEDELALIEATRKKMATVLRSLADEVYNRVGIHTFKGLVPLSSILTGATGHIEHHLKFIEEKRKALGI
ncbi:DinB family protein [Zavarzinella formosa]|uniref:DinB family protein n=1 Tax=Zavarzinella formosa TaxID=360055 RepID=UPI0002EE84B0|nr:DinB family protein [Zavarzinella formosa]